MVKNHKNKKDFNLVWMNLKLIVKLSSNLVKQILEGSQFY